MSIVIQKRRARVRPVRFRSAIEKLAVFGVSGGVARHEGHFAITLFPSRRNAAMRQPRSVALAGQLLRHPRVEQATRLLVGDCERAVAEAHFKSAHCWIVPDAAAASGTSRVSGRTATDCGFAVRFADLLFRRGGVRPAALPFGSIVLKKSKWRVRKIHPKADFGRRRPLRVVGKGAG
jgi:hypothetical protein